MVNDDDDFGVCTICYICEGYEVFERMAYYGIASNLVVYLTGKLHEGTVTSSNNVTNWVGTVWMTPILGAYIADAHLGRFWTFVIASAIYLLVTRSLPQVPQKLYAEIYIIIFIYFQIYIMHRAKWNTKIITVQQPRAIGHSDDFLYCGEHIV